MSDFYYIGIQIVRANGGSEPIGTLERIGTRAESEEEAQQQLAKIKASVPLSGQLGELTDVLRQLTNVMSKVPKE